MKQCIETYEKQQSNLKSLGVLTQDLEHLLDTLITADSTWMESFRTEWWELELTFSIMLDKDQELLTQEDEEAVNLALINMKIMIDNYRS